MQVRYLMTKNYAWYLSIRHCTDTQSPVPIAIKRLGFVPVGTCGEWRSCFYNAELKIFLMVYVDDFKMSGPKEHVESMWQKFKELGEDDSLQIGAPQALGHFLGCEHDVLDRRRQQCRH